MADYIRMGVNKTYAPLTCHCCGSALELFVEEKDNDDHARVYKCTSSDDMLFHVHMDPETGTYVQARTEDERCMWCRTEESPVKTHASLSAFCAWFEATYTDKVEGSHKPAEFVHEAHRDHLNALHVLCNNEAEIETMDDAFAALHCAPIVMAYARACAWLNRPNAFAKRPSGAKKAKTQ
jgi:hypothetical protein